MNITHLDFVWGDPYTNCGERVAEFCLNATVYVNLLTRTV